MINELNNKIKIKCFHCRKQTKIVLKNAIRSALTHYHSDIYKRPEVVCIKCGHCKNTFHAFFYYSDNNKSLGYVYMEDNGKEKNEVNTGTILYDYK